MPIPTLPTLFLSHGSPMLAVEPGEAGHFMQRLGPVIDATWGRPRAIVIMSPHTATRTPLVLGAERHHTVHDFGGFPPELYEIRYNAPGDPVLSRQVAKLLGEANGQTEWSAQSGLDHGIWTTLMHVYPKADVPIVPVSLTPQASPAELMAFGRALSPLRHEGVLIIGSGSLTHNLRRFFTRPVPMDAPEEPDCAAFRAWVAECAHAGDWPALLDYRAQAPHAVQMHPTDEHWLPFYFAAGAASDGTQDDVEDMPESALRLHAGVTHGHLAMDAYGFGSADQLANCAKALSN
jgi:4,5-DOPA dioxygenase extradiol